MTRAATHFIVNAAVEAGKGLISTTVSSQVDSIGQTHGGDGLFTYKHAQLQTIGAVVEAEARAMAVETSRLARMAEADKWRGMQELYDSIGATRDTAYSLQYAETLEGWFSALAQQAHGRTATVDGTEVSSIDGLTFVERMLLGMAIQQGNLSTIDDGLRAKLVARFGEDWEKKVGTRTDLRALADDWDTSSVGTLGLHVRPSRDPTQDLAVQYCEIERSEGNNEAIRSYFLNTSRPLRQMRMPKLVIGQFMSAPGWSLGGAFNAVWDEAGNWRSSTYGGGVISLDGSDTNAGRAWVAMYGKRSKSLSSSEVDTHFPSGITRIERDILDQTLKGLGVSKIDT